jgi:dolichol kinase
MTNEDVRIPSAMYGLFVESILIATSIALVVLIFVLRPEYYALSLALILLVCTWYALRTIVNYTTGNPIILYLVRLQDPTKKFARSCVVVLVTLMLLLIYAGIFTRYF